MFTVISVPFASTCVQPLYVVSVFIVFWIFCVLLVALFCWRSLYIVHSFLVNVFVFINVYIHCKYEWIIFILKATLSDHVTDQWYFSFDEFVCVFLSLFQLMSASYAVSFVASNFYPETNFYLILMLIGFPFI